MLWYYAIVNKGHTVRFKTLLKSMYVFHVFFKFYKMYNKQKISAIITLWIGGLFDSLSSLNA